MAGEGARAPETQEPVQEAAGRRLTYFLGRVCSQRYRAAWSRAGAAEGARRAASQGFLRSPRAVGSFQPACFLAGHPLQMEAGLLERGPTVFLPPTAVAPRTSPFTLERTRPSRRFWDPGLFNPGPLSHGLGTSPGPQAQAQGLPGPGSEHLLQDWEGAGFFPRCWHFPTLVPG